MRIRVVLRLGAAALAFVTVSSAWLATDPVAVTPELRPSIFSDIIADMAPIQGMAGIRNSTGLDSGTPTVKTILPLELSGWWHGPEPIGPFATKQILADCNYCKVPFVSPENPKTAARETQRVRQLVIAPVRMMFDQLTDGDCRCLQPAEVEWPSHPHVHPVGKDGLEVSTNVGKNKFAFRSAGQNPKAVSFGLEAKFGSLVNTQLDVRRKTDGGFQPGSQSRVGNLQSAFEGDRDWRALTEFSATAHLLDNRISMSSSRRYSNLVSAEDPGSRAWDEAEQYHLGAVVWQSDTVTLSLTGDISRIGPNYRDITGTNPSDPLQAHNRLTHQIGSTIKVGRTSFYVRDRDAVALLPSETVGTRQWNSQIETGASVDLKDLRGETSEKWTGHFLSLLPDSIWLGGGRGELGTVGTGTKPDAAAESLSAGAIRSWKNKTAYVSYWRSDTQSMTGLEDTRWAGHGMEFGGSMYSKHWTLGGNLALYAADNVAAWNNTAEESIGTSLFLTWHSNAGLDLTTGLTTRRYGTAFLDYDGLNQSDLLHYQFALDLSRLATTQLEKRTMLKLLASFETDANHFQWSLTRSDRESTGLFVGFKLGFPLYS